VIVSLDRETRNDALQELFDVVLPDRAAVLFRGPPRSIAMIEHDRKIIEFPVD
jgi:hypothetical protein